MLRPVGGLASQRLAKSTDAPRRYGCEVQSLRELAAKPDRVPGGPHPSAGANDDTVHDGSVDAPCCCGVGEVGEEVARQHPPTVFAREGGGGPLPRSSKTRRPAA